MKRNRPIIDVPRTSLEMVLELCALVCLIGLIAVTVWGWLSLPATVPTHFDVAGRPNAYGGKGGMLFLPGLFTAVYVLFMWVESIPHTYNYPVVITEENAAGQYRLARMLLEWMKLEILAVGVMLEWSIIQAMGSGNGGAILAIGLAVPVMLLVTIVVYFRKASRAR